jgi:hypothetical protein
MNSGKALLPANCCQSFGGVLPSSQSQEPVRDKTSYGRLDHSALVSWSRDMVTHSKRVFCCPSAKLRHAANSRRHSAGHGGSLQARPGYTTAEAPTEGPPAKPSSVPNTRTCCTLEWARHNTHIFCPSLLDSLQAWRNSFIGLMPDPLIPVGQKPRSILLSPNAKVFGELIHEWFEKARLLKQR